MEATGGVLIYLFGLMLPASAFCWTAAFLGAGFLRQPDDQPRVFRLVARAGILPKDAGARLLLASVGLVFTNGAQLLFLMKSPFGAGSAVVVAYFLAEAIWLGTVVREIRRARSRTHGRKDDE